jgi:uncharacterized protein YecT (DUF1311 family)
VVRPLDCLEQHDATAQQLQCLRGQLVAAQVTATGLLRQIRLRDAQVGAGVAQAQTFWVRYRDAQCLAEGRQFAGGSLQPVTVQLCLAQLSTERNAVLRRVWRNLTPPAP